MHVLFTAININSRYGYAYYGKNKEASTILQFLEQFTKNIEEINNIKQTQEVNLQINTVKYSFKIIT